MAEIKLRKCPFCGGEAQMWESDITGRALIYCSCCDAGISLKKNIAEAIEAWNKRVGEVAE